MNAKAQPILSARGIVNRFGKQEVHDRITCSGNASFLIFKQSG